MSVSREAAIQEEVKEAHRLGDRQEPPARLSELRQRERIGQRQQLRGRPLISPEGKPIGVIKTILIGADGHRLSALRLDDGRRIPADEVEIDGELVVYHGAYEEAVHWRKEREEKLREARQVAHVAELKRESLSGLALSKEPVTSWLTVLVFVVILLLNFAIAFPGHKPRLSAQDRLTIVPYDQMPSALGPLNQAG